MRALNSFVLLALCGACSVTAQEHDLRLHYRYAQGDKLRVSERQAQRREVRVRRGTEVVERDTQRDGVEQRYVLEVLEVTEAGDLQRARRTYEALRLLSTDEEVEVAGIQVVFTRTPEGMTYTKESEGPLPASLKAVLDEAGDGSAPTENTEVLFPSEPVAVGGSWTREPGAIAELFGLEPKALLPRSKVTGSLVARLPRPGASPLLHSRIAIQLRASRFQGLPAKRPFTFELECETKLPADGGDAAQDVRVKGRVRGAAASPAKDGTVLELDLDLDLTLNRETLP